MLDESLASGYFDEPLQKPLSASLSASYPQLAVLPLENQKSWLWRHYNSLAPAERAELIKQAVGDEVVTFTSTTKLNSVFGHGVDPDALLFPRASAEGLCEKIRAPGLFITGWYDWCFGDTLHTWGMLMQHAQEDAWEGSRLLITSSGHNAPGYLEGFDGNRGLGRIYRTDDNLELLLHFYESARADKADEIPIVTYFLMGANEWQTASAWPLPETMFTPFYLGDEAALTLKMPDSGSTPLFTYTTPRTPLRPSVEALSLTSIVPAAPIYRSCTAGRTY